MCFRRQKSTESAGSDDEDVDELSLIDHKEIMSRITLKQEVSQQSSLMLCFVFWNLLWQSCAAPAYKAHFIPLVPGRLKFNASQSDVKSDLQIAITDGCCCHLELNLWNCRAETEKPPSSYTTSFFVLCGAVWQMCESAVRCTARLGK